MSKENDNNEEVTASEVKAVLDGLNQKVKSGEKLTPEEEGVFKKCMNWVQSHPIQSLMAGIITLATFVAIFAEEGINIVYGVIDIVGDGVGDF